MTTLAVPFFMGDAMPGFAVPEPHEILDPQLPDADPQHRMAVLYNELAGWVAKTDDPVVYAGDCVSTIGVLAGLQRRRVNPSLLFFDAHGDFHTWETSQSGFIGGMPLAMLTGRGEQTIVAGAGLTTLSDERVVLVDGRDLDLGEDEAVATAGIDHQSVADLVDHVPDGPLYVHVDGDVVDPNDMPAMNYPAPNGPSLAEVRQAMISLQATGRVVAFSVSSWNPALPGADVAAAATAHLAAPFL
ncbi:MAG: arginase family protein [bacterium]|nr:arginase family protein [bacterium]MCP4965253.1 arginase family protein [bacterium]